MQTTPYTWLMLAGIFVGLAFWIKFAPRERSRVIIYFAALGGAFLGAKIIYLLAEGWLHWHEPNRWLHWATGKTILGALLGGYAGVEYAKSRLGSKTITGDWFAAIAPISIILGRLGCWKHGCCLGAACPASCYTIDDGHGVTRWPAVQAEILFNLLAATTFLILRRRKLLLGQHFHLYLIAYGAFRFAHEFLRETPRLLGPFSGYHFAALAVVALGAIRFQQRTAKNPSRPRPEDLLQPRQQKCMERGHA